MFSWSTDCAWGHYHAGTCSDLLVPVKRNFNAIACKDGGVLVTFGKGQVLTRTINTEAV